MGGGTLRSPGAGDRGAGRGLTRPSPVHLLSPSPACPGLTHVPSSPRPRRRLLLSPTGPPVPLALLAARLAGPAGPGQAAVSSPPPPCWPFAHPTGGPTAPQPPVGPAPALTWVGGGGWERRSWCGRAPGERFFGVGRAPRERRSWKGLAWEQGFYLGEGPRGEDFGVADTLGGENCMWSLGSLASGAF